MTRTNLSITTERWQAPKIPRHPMARTTLRRQLEIEHQAAIDRIDLMTAVAIERCLMLLQPRG